MYRLDLKDELPPHLYAIGYYSFIIAFGLQVAIAQIINIMIVSANRVLRNISLQRPQSILLTGETGSGKTKSSTVLLSFLQFSSLSIDVKSTITAAGIIFEAFGNAQTNFNTNSSRFTKLTKVSNIL